METVPSLNVVIAVAIGGACGACLRYLISLVGARLESEEDRPRIPWYTFAANVLGALLLGFVLRVSAEAEISPDSPLYMGLAVGVCGALTTMSSFALEVVQLFRRSATVESIGYLLLTLGSVMAAFILAISIPGYWL
ncbi:fluoride efflux transporter CrcB [Dermabacteraceae bacterium P7074]